MLILRQKPLTKGVVVSIEIKRKTVEELLEKVNIVGVVNTIEAARSVQNYAFSMDIVEWRYDCIPDDEVETQLRACGKPIIFTVRSPQEGGDGDLSVGMREDILYKYIEKGLPTFIDIEYACLEALSGVVADAQASGIGIIVSHHGMSGLPHIYGYSFLYTGAMAVGADILKIAIKSEAESAFMSLSDFVLFRLRLKEIKIAPMMMGKRFGKASRILFAAGGSPLVYGHLGDAKVEGQIRVDKLREVLDEVL